MPSAPAAQYLDALPPRDVVLKVLEESPAVKAAREQMGIASARQRRLAAGEYEWAIGATGQRRTDAMGATFSEQAYELSRGLRWFGKAGIDRRLGAQTAAVGEYAFGDAWHEAARTLLAGWFEWLRAGQEAKLLGAQMALLEDQLRKVQSRVRAGDAPRVEQALAQTEIDRASAAQMAAELRVREIALQLKRTFPDLVLAAPAELDAPDMPSGSDEEWAQRILADNHEIELAEGQYEQAKLAARRASRDRIPDPTVGLRYSNNLDGNDRLVSVIVTLPLGGSRRSAQQAVALGEANVAGQHAREIRLKVESDAQRAILAMRSTQAQWQRLRDVAAQSETNAATVARGYSLGEFTITELLTARRQALDAALIATTAQLDALEAASRLQLDAHEIWSAEGPPPG